MWKAFIDSIWFKSLLLPFVVTVGTAWFIEEKIDHHHWLRASTEGFVNGNSPPSYTYEVVVDNPGDLAEREVAVAIRFLRLSGGFVVMDAVWQASSPLLSEQLTLKGPEHEMGFQTYHAILPSLNPGEWARLTFRITEPVAVYVDVRSTETSAEAQFIHEAPS